MMIIFEILLIFFLILANGFFAGSEIALISARKSRIKQLAEEGHLRAKKVQRLQNDPDRFLATIQIGITIVGSLASAVAGALAMEVLKPVFEQVPIAFIQEASGPLAVGLVVLVISYLTLTFGELIPKSLALRFAEPIALWVARPLEMLSSVSAPFLRFLTVVSSLALRPFGAKAAALSPFITEEDIKCFLKEGREKGIFDQTEQELIHSVFDFTDISVKEVMVPRAKVKALQIDTPPDDVLRILAESKFSRYPVYRKGLDDTCGILNYKDFLVAVKEAGPASLSDLLHPVFFVPETTKISRLLKELQRRRMQMAVVINEYGSVEGIVTVEDLIEEIVGEIRDEYDVEEKPVERLKDGSLVVDASLSVRDLQTDYGLPVPESTEFETLAGFVLSHFQGVPKGGDILTFEGLKFTVVDMEGRRISRVKVERTPQTV